MGTNMPTAKINKETAFDIISEAFDEPIGNIELISKPEDLDGWDSMGILMLMADYGVIDLVILAVSPADAAIMLRVSRGMIYKLLKQGRLRSFKIGRCCRIDVKSINELVLRLPEYST